MCIDCALERGPVGAGGLEPDGGGALAAAPPPEERCCCTPGRPSVPVEELAASAASSAFAVCCEAAVATGGGGCASCESDATESGGSGACRAPRPSSDPRPAAPRPPAPRPDAIGGAGAGAGGERLPVNVASSDCACEAVSELSTAGLLNALINSCCCCCCCCFCCCCCCCCCWLLDAGSGLAAPVANMPFVDTATYILGEKKKPGEKETLSSSGNYCTSVHL